MIKFICEGEKAGSPVFGDVEDDQFFVNNDGDLCQKSTPRTYNIIATMDRRPWASAVNIDMDANDRILRILPHVSKIEF